MTAEIGLFGGSGLYDLPGLEDLSLIHISEPTRLC